MECSINIDDITDFVFKYSTYTDREKFKERLKKHIQYKTCFSFYDDSGVVGFCMWNILPNGRDAHIFDLVIAPQYRYSKMMLSILRKGLEMYPSAENLIFEKGYDDGNKIKPLKKYSIRDFLRRLGNEKNNEVVSQSESLQVSRTALRQ